jgi:putative ABC transport system substrate-binding protein
MRRRDLLVGLLATTGASAVWAAEPNKAYRVAVCTQLGMAVFSTPFYARFFDRLRQLKRKDFWPMGQTLTTVLIAMQA